MTRFAIHLLDQLLYSDFEQNVKNTVLRKSILNENMEWNVGIVVGGI